jgi:hypothetical protein
MSETSLKVKSASPTLKEILKKVDERNANAAVDIYIRLMLGLLGLAGAVTIFVFAAPDDKMLGLGFLIIPVFPVFFGVSDDFADARRELLKERNETEK